MPNFLKTNKEEAGAPDVLERLLDLGSYRFVWAHGPNYLTFENIGSLHIEFHGSGSGH